MRLGQPETHYVDVGDAQVAYQVVGDGPIDLVYHHGLCHLDLQWDVGAESEFNRSLASFTRLILFDRRGTGASQRLPDRVAPTLDDWAVDLLTVLDEVGSTSPAIFAESDAGAMAIRLAATNPDRVSQLVLANTAARFARSDDYPIGMGEDEIESRVRTVEAAWTDTEIWRMLFPGVAHNPADIAALARLARASATPRMVREHFDRMLRETDVRADLADVRTPVLVLDTGGPQTKFSRFLAAGLPDATLAETPSDAALLFGDDFDHVMSEVAPFLTGSRRLEITSRRFVTLLFTDIVGSTERASTLGDRRWRTLLDAHDGVVRDILSRFGGREVNTTGDGFVAAFDQPSAAIRSAERVLASLRDVGISARAGVHSGECEIRGDDVAGIAVHIAARVAAAAAPGEVAVSRTVADLVLGSDLVLDDGIPHDLKGVPGSWTIHTLQPGPVD